MSLQQMPVRDTGMTKRGYSDDKKRSTGMTAALRHTAAVSLNIDPANK
ncbi:hypothetical protein [Wolbachia endosymbiont (group A) of Andrena trimmerana]